MKEVSASAHHFFFLWRSTSLKQFAFWCELHERTLNSFNGSDLSIKHRKFFCVEKLSFRLKLSFSKQKISLLSPKETFSLFVHKSVHVKFKKGSFLNADFSSIDFLFIWINTTNELFWFYAEDFLPESCEAPHFGRLAYAHSRRWLEDAEDSEVTGLSTSERSCASCNISPLTHFSFSVAKL